MIENVGVTKPWAMPITQEIASLSLAGTADLLVLFPRSAYAQRLFSESANLFIS